MLKIHPGIESETLAFIQQLNMIWLLSFLAHSCMLLSQGNELLEMDKPFALLKGST